MTQTELERKAAAADKIAEIFRYHNPQHGGQLSVYATRLVQMALEEARLR